MIKLKIKPEFLRKNGTPEFVILSYDDFLKMESAIEDSYDLKALRDSKAQQATAKRTSLTTLKKTFSKKLKK